jgi:transcription antitermination factor NusA-like protein
LAIGKLGQNVKLAVQACGWSIDIKSEAMAQGEGILILRWVILCPKLKKLRFALVLSQRSVT